LEKLGESFKSNEFQGMIRPRISQLREVDLKLFYTSNRLDYKAFGGMKANKGRFAKGHNNPSEP
jgi:hypothetical protein